MILDSATASPARKGCLRLRRNHSVIDGFEKFDAVFRVAIGTLTLSEYPMLSHPQLTSRGVGT